MNSNFITEYNMEKRECKPLIAEGKPLNKFFYFTWAIMASILFGTKFFFLELSHLSQIWIFFIMHVTICITALIAFIFYFLLSRSHQSTLGNYIWRDNWFAKNKKLIFLAFGAGTINALGNISIIFAIKTAHDAGSSPAVISTILMLNVLIALLAGLILFGESHTIVQYIGGVMIIGAIILIAFERSLEIPGVYTDIQNMKHLVAVFWALITWFSFSFMIIITKWAWYYFNVNVVEYSCVTMALSGFVGALSFIPLQYYHTPLEAILYSNFQEYWVSKEIISVK